MSVIDQPSRTRGSPLPKRHAGLAPLVSVVVPVRDGRATLARALSSVAAQDYPRIEVIVVDDGSVDEVGEVVDAFSQLEIKFDHLATSRGAAAARNKGLTLCAGEFVAFLDADDEWLADKTRLQVEALTRDPELSFTHASAIAVLRGRDCGLVSEAADIRAHGSEAWKTLLKHGCVVTSSVMARRARIVEQGGFNGGLAVGEDQDLWIRLAERGAVHHEARPLVRKHSRPSSIMNQHRGAIANVTLPMIEAHVARLGDRLTARERADILAYRRLVAGRNCYEAGNLRTGARLVLSAAGEHGLLRSGLYLASASPLAQRAKSLFGRRRASSDAFHPADLAPLQSPRFTAVVDVRGAAGESSGWLEALSRVFVEHGLSPTLIVDDRVLDDAPMVMQLAAFRAQSEADLGVGLPPQSSDAEARYGTDVKALARLTARVVRRFGLRPVVHGGDDPTPDAARARALSAMGYEIDVYAPARSKARPNSLHWFGESGDLLGVPLLSPLREIDTSRLKVCCLHVGPSLSVAALEAALRLLQAGGARSACLREIRAAILQG